jgi:hypothetical protein
MNRKFVAFTMVVIFASAASAGPFGLLGRRGGGATTTSNQNTQGGTVYQQPRFPVANAFLGSAQGVANHLASVGRIGHFGGNPYAFEGVGMGVSPDHALRNCCNNGGTVADYGVCQGANGMWYACKRYHSR